MTLQLLTSINQSIVDQAASSLFTIGLLIQLRNDAVMTLLLIILQVIETCSNDITINNTSSDRNLLFTSKMKTVRTVHLCDGFIHCRSTRYPETFKTIRRSRNKPTTLKY